MTSTPSPQMPRDWGKPLFTGKTFVLAGYAAWEREQFILFLAAEGGQLVVEVTDSLDYLVHKNSGTLPCPAESKARQHNQNGARIQILSDAGLHDLCTPTPEDALDLLDTGPAGVERWNALRRPRNLREIDLGRADFRGAKLAGVNWRAVKLDGADFRDADLTASWFPGIADVRFEGACLERAQLSKASRCNFDGARLVGTTLAWVGQCRFVNADLTGAVLRNGDLGQCDFSGAMLRKSVLPRIQVRSAVFAGADLGECQLGQWQASRSNLCQVNLSRANLVESNLKQTQLNGANLGRAVLARACLAGADLRGADLRGANLIAADLSEAQVAGANFEGAYITGATLTGVAVSQAVGLDPAQTQGGGAVGPHIYQLDALLKKQGRIHMSVRIDLPEGPLDLQLHACCCGHPSVTLAGTLGKTTSSNYTNSFAAALFDKTRQWAHGKLRPEALQAQSHQCEVKGKALRDLAIAAWCEAFGLEMPAAGVLAQREAALRGEQSRQRQQLLEELRGGPEGVEQWNARYPDERKKAVVRGRLDLSGARLDRAMLATLPLRRAQFANASLVRACLERADCRQASFANADLREAAAVSGRFKEAQFQNASLRQGRFVNASFRDASLAGADLEGADFTNTDLCGADLTGARLEAVNLRKARYDQKTRFPADFRLADGMKWFGKGGNPHLPGFRACTPGHGEKPAEPLDREGFLARLEAVAEPQSLKSARQMLKRERMQLFALVEDGLLAGVIRSRTIPSLSYACLLAPGGLFACCSTHLKGCGVMRHGKLCQHLLVLLLGLARAGRLDLGRIGQWVADSTFMPPNFDKEVIGEVMLRYKGAEAGEIDWRPTETIPEDFYTF